MDKYQNIVVVDVAIVAKEIGFNEICKVSYTEYLKDGDGQFHDTEYKAGEIYYGDQFVGRNKDYPRTYYYEQYAAPTVTNYELWLQRNHGFVVWCVPEEVDGHFSHFRVCLQHPSWPLKKHFGIMRKEQDKYVEVRFDSFIKAKNYGLWKASQLVKRGSVLN